jgi:type IV pilus assembly protein PilM
VGGRHRDLTVLLPDAAARVVLLDFDTLPEKRQEAEPVVRFRLKKSLPFDVEKAAISFQAFQSDDAVRVVAAVVLSSVLEEYEAAFRDTGYNPGVVIPATLAALGPLDAQAPTLVIKADAATTCVAMLKSEQLLLYRVIENAAGNATNPDSLAEEVYPSVVFFEDTYGAKVERILVAGIAGTEQLGAALEAQTGIRAQELVRPAQVGSSGGSSRALLAGVVGALTA